MTIGLYKSLSGSVTTLFKDANGYTTVWLCGIVCIYPPMVQPLLCIHMHGWPITDHAVLTTEGSPGEVAAWHTTAVKSGHLLV